MLLVKLANKIINKQTKSQRKNMTDFMIYKDIDQKYQTLRMTYSKDKTRYISSNVVNNTDAYDKKVSLTTTRVPVILTIDKWEEPIRHGSSNVYGFTYRLEDGDREAIYNFKGLPTLVDKNGYAITSIMVNNTRTGVWITIECKNDNPRLIIFDLEKISIEVLE